VKLPLSNCLLPLKWLVYEILQKYCYRTPYFNNVFCIFLYSGNENWLSLDRKVLDHDLPRYADPIVFYFAVRFVNLCAAGFFHSIIY
jgi:hypothetical protein